MVILCNTGTRLSFQTALALQEAELLKQYTTSYYYSESSILSRLLKAFPSQKIRNLERQLKRRYLKGLEASYVDSAALTEIAFIGARRLGLSPILSDPLLKWRNFYLASRFDSNIRRSRPKAVICCDSWAKDRFRVCEEVGALKILDQNTGHISKMAQILNEEIELHPDFADSITPFSKGLIENCTEEALAADAVFLSSEYAKESLVDIGVLPEKIYHIPYAADLERFHPAPDNKRNLGKEVNFLFVGIIGQRKGIKYLLEAFKKLKLKNAKLNLTGVIIGSGNGLKPYADIFTHTPSVPYQEIHQHFQQADVFVFPSLHESGVLAIHEALASGLPVITTPNAGSVVRDGKEGFIVPIRSVEALAEKIELLYENTELRQQMSKNARARAEEFPWERYRQSIGKTVNDLITA